MWVSGGNLVLVNLIMAAMVVLVFNSPVNS